MEFKPCKEDSAADFGVVLCAFIWPIAFYIVCDWEWPFKQIYIIAVLPIELFLLIDAARNFVYFTRTIVLDCKGCTFSFLGFQRNYKWSDLNVCLCENTHQFNFYDESMGPGVLLCPKEAKCPRKKPAMAFCRHSHPFSSVFLRYKTLEDDERITTGKVHYYGYSVEKNALLDYLKSIDVLRN